MTWTTWATTDASRRLASSITTCAHSPTGCAATEAHSPIAFPRWPRPAAEWHHGGMGLFTQRPEFDDELPGLPGEPLRPTTAAERLDDASPIDLGRTGDRLARALGRVDRDPRRAGDRDRGVSGVAAKAIPRAEPSSGPRRADVDLVPVGVRERPPLGRVAVVCDDSARGERCRRRDPLPRPGAPRRRCASDRRSACRPAAAR